MLAERLAVVAADHDQHLRQQSARRKTVEQRPQRHIAQRQVILVARQVVSPGKRLRTLQRPRRVVRVMPRYRQVHREKRLPGWLRIDKLQQPLHRGLLIYAEAGAVLTGDSASILQLAKAARLDDAAHPQVQKPARVKQRRLIARRRKLAGQPRARQSLLGVARRWGMRRWSSRAQGRKQALDALGIDRVGVREAQRLPRQQRQPWHRVLRCAKRLQVLSRSRLQHHPQHTAPLGDAAQG